MWGPKPIDRKFFDAFCQHATVTARAAGMLLELFGEPMRADLPVRIEADEHEGDEILHSLVDTLRGTWITPFDRQDIQNLISRLDDVLDLIHATAKRVLLFEFEKTTPEAVAMARFILTASEAVKKAVELLNDMKRSEEILKLCELINEIENEGDELYRQVLGRLYRKGSDPLEVMKWREVYDHLETALDRCEDVADQIGGLVLEYS
jgi:predicted phosphate transport protein (TIGR00153 family)